ncbi:hypothetical protein DPV78_000029 [Talaromyces pinophilus]|nr:hypothetical protein DPV78_000029 [Talaromyces pinophilus]
MYDLSPHQVLASAYTMIVLTGIAIISRFFLRGLRKEPFRLEDGFMLFAFVAFNILASITIVVVPVAYEIIAVSYDLRPIYNGLFDDEVYQLRVMFANLYWKLDLNIDYVYSDPRLFQAGCTSERDVNAQIANLYYVVVTEILTDVLIMALPIIVLRQANLARPTYYRTAGIFSVGIICIVVALSRGITIGTRVKVNTPTLPWILIWEMIEGGIAVIVGCLPSYAVFIIQARKQAGSRTTQRTVSVHYKPRDIEVGRQDDNFVTENLITRIKRRIQGTLAAKRPFSIHDDVLAYPQYKVSFPEEYVLETEADIILQLQKDSSSNDASSSNTVSDKRDLQRHASQRPIGGWKTTGKKDRADLDWDPELSLKYFSYEEMKLDGLRYLCNIPRVNNGPENDTTTEKTGGSDGAGNQTQDENEIARATDRGLELLKEMEDTCMYYVSGWWSYSFCYKKHVKQFHAKSGPGVPNYPPIEDQTSHSFVLGKFQHDDEESDTESGRSSKSAKASTAELQTKGESRYLVQRLSGGTVCDLTGAERKIEVQFHCNPQSTDRIGWIKELTTCSYLMVIYTPRLCHDVAFQLPQFEETHSIQCREILAPDEIADFDAMKAHHDQQKLINADIEEAQFVGGIEVGAKKEVGSDGKVIEKGRMARIGEETVQIIAKREDGELAQLSNKDLKKFNLNPKEVENFANQLDEKAKGGDWRLEIVESNGETSYRAIISSGGDEEDDENVDGEKKEGAEETKEQTPLAKDSKDDETAPSEEKKGSEETYKDEL